MSGSDVFVEKCTGESQAIRNGRNGSISADVKIRRAVHVRSYCLGVKSYNGTLADGIYGRGLIRPVVI